MNAMNAKRYSWLTAIALTAVLTACGRPDETVGQKVDGAIAQGRDAMQDAKTATKEGVDSAQRASKDVVASAEKSLERTAEASRDSTTKMGEAIDDAAITASISASLAKDADLSAIKIDVDTKNGRVSLHGPAPSELAKTRASTIAQSVKGVVSVDNQLTIKKSG
jgi:hyperosmotically inducible periplasmic protein